jgi:putative RNA 2'-phosphotransferase
LLDHIVATNPKKRFAFNEDRTKIRASQGHSITIDLGYEPQSPPEILYHGTASRHLDSIFKSGLQKQSRHHVHLSDNFQTAETVGQRHGKPTVLHVSSAKMEQDGFLFFKSENGVWLTDEVPPRYIVQN